MERPATADRPDPSFVLGFAVPREQAHGAVARWLKGRSLFVKSGFKRAMLEELKGIYVPAFLYSAAVHSRYSADIGEDYTETESYTVTVNGKTERRTRTVTKTEWRPLQGTHAEFAPELVVTASRGLPNQELEKIEPFDLRAMRRYQPSLLAGWIAEEVSMERDACRELARDEAHSRAARRIKEFLPGDHQRGLQVGVELHDEAMEPCLVPVWVGAVRYDKEAPAVRVLVNGQSGKVWGKAPLSWVKIALTALAACGAIAAIAWFVSSRM